MGKRHAPHRGTLQFWPRVRAQREAARIRQWVTLKETKPLGFLGYKAGMCHVIAIDNRAKSLSKDEEISIPATIIECPPLKVAGLQFYRSDGFGLQVITTVLSSNIDKELGRVFSLPKKITQKIEDVKAFDDVRLLVYTQPRLTGMGTKRPAFMELALGGSKEEKMKYATERLGKEILVEEVIKEGHLVDIHAITKGKGFQGPVKRHGVMLRHHKSEKARRANVRGPWTGPKMWTVPHSGKMGYNQRVEYNKWILKVGKNPSEVSRSGGIPQFGVVKNSFILIKGSVAGVQKRVVTLTPAIRPQRGVPKDAPSIRAIVL